MKRLFSHALLLLSLTITTQAQQTSWQWVNPLPQGNLLNGLAAVNQDTVFAVGDYGTVIRSTNGGVNWNVLPNAGGMSEQLFGVHFPTSQTGYAVGTTGQYVKTTDGGATWFYHQAPTLSDLYAAHFVSASTGWIAGAFGTILGTTNGGATWNAESTTTTLNLYAINFANSTTGWASGAGGKILKTTNGGLTWASQTSGIVQPLYALDFTSATTGYAVGAFGNILKTVNGGSTWLPQISSTSYSLYTAQFTSASVGWAAGSFGTILKTTNGGLNWFAQSSNSYNDIYGMAFISATTGWMGGDFGTLLGTIDGGTNWVVRSSGTKNILNSIHFPDPQTGYSVGEEGTIVKTTDGGLSWLPQSSGLYQTLYGVYFASSSVGWAVGDSAVILRTTTGGANWVEQNSHSEMSLYSVHFANATNGWAVGDFGTILASSNGGVTWAPQTSGTSTTLLRIRFITPSIGWAVGYSGKILKTSNGGTTWLPQTSGTAQTLYSIEIVDANTVLVVGDFGLVLKSTNGGTTWGALATDTDASLYGIAFYTPSLGWAAGDDGTVIRTSDGGGSWITQKTGTFNTLYEVQLSRGVSGGVVFAAGLGGTIVCSGVSPLPVRTWVGTFDSLWTTAGNWSPNGIPQKIDSVMIPPSARNPYLRTNLQQINIASLRINAGAKLTIGSGLTELVVKGSVIIDGTVDFEAPSNIDIMVGKDFIVSLTGVFNPSQSTVRFTNDGQIRGNFYSVLIEQGANMNSIGNISIKNNLLVLSNLTLRASDTLSILNPYALSFQGNGSTGAGTIKRAIQGGSTDTYRFESPGSFVRFYPGGILPDTITVSTILNSYPPGLPESLFVKRYYDITANGGSSYMSTLSLRYDTSETTIPIENLGLFRDSSNVVRNMGQSDFLDTDYVAILVDSVRRFSRWYIGYYDYIPIHAFAFTDSLILTDNGGIKDTLTFGAQPFATLGIDAAFGETQLGPKPGGGTFDVRWDIPATLGSLVDFHDVISQVANTNTYTASIQPGPGGYPFTIQWNTATLPPGTFLLRDQATQGTQFSVNMKTQSSFIVTNASISKIQILHVGPTYYAFQKNWNLLSLPLTPAIDGRRTRNFPSAISAAFYFSDGYQVADTMKNGKGYWLKFTAAQEIGIDGFARSLDTVNVVEGWNMIGSISTGLRTSNVGQIPPGTVVSSYYRFTTGYTISDSILPARGYWVKAAAPGKLVLSSSPQATPKQQSEGWNEELTSLNRLVISDAEGNTQTLYFDRTPLRPAFKQYYELPPMPPKEIFDARFSTGGLVEALENHPTLPAITVQATGYPLTIEWHIQQGGIRSVKFINASGDAPIANSSAALSGSFQIEDPAITSFILGIDAETIVPKSFALKQNYPNPFNPLTRLSFDLPERGLVDLRVFNILGQEVASLVNNAEYMAGSHAELFDGSNLGSGVYFYRLTVHGASGKNYGQVRKMLLVK